MKFSHTLKLSLLAAIASITLSTVAADVQYYLAVKGLSLRQTNSSAPVVVTNESPFRFVAEVLASNSNSVTNVTVTLPSKTIVTVTNVAGEEEPADFALEQGFTNKTLLDAKFAAGAYKFIIRALNDGSNGPTLTLPKDLYPAAPHIANWADAQEIESKLPFVIRWDASTNVGVNDLVLFNVEETNGNSVLSSPGFFQPGALNGTNVFVEIPLESLDPDHVYDAQLLVVKAAVRNTNSVPGANGIGGYFRQTKFPLVTLPLPTSGGRVQFSSLNYSASESDSAATVTVTRVGHESNPVSVNFTTSDGTAADGTNYTGVNTTLTFDSDVTSTNISIPLLNDYKLTGNKTVNLALSGLVGEAVFGSRSNSVLTIVDSQKVGAGTLQFSPAVYSVAESLATVTITITRTAGTTGAVGVNFHTVDGSAQGGLDYVATNGTIIIPTAKTSATLPIRIINDSINETNETFFVALDSTTGGAALGTNLFAKVTILDNDPGGVVSLGSATYTTNENSGFFLLTVKRAGTGTLASGASVDFTTEDGTALAGADYFATNGTLTFGSNELTKTISVAITNDILAEGNENFFFHITNPQGGASLGAISNATLTIKDDESSVSFSNATYTVSEAGPSLVVSVVRSGALITPVSVDFNTADITATAGADYTATNGTLSFPANIPVKTITIPIKEDSLVEGDQTFSVQLTNPQGGVQLGAITNTTVTITDNDFGGSISFATNSYSVSESGTNATITLVRSNGLASAVTVDFITADGLATAGLDYSNATQTVTFNAGETSKKVLVPIISDTIVEGNETVLLTLTNATGGASLGIRTNATLTIVDDDLGGTINFKTASISANENATNFVVSVIRTGGKASGVSVNFHTQAGTATSGVDYSNTIGTLNFAAGETNKTILVPIINDALAEGSETLNLLLDSATGGATVGTTNNATLTIVDDESSISLGTPVITVSEAGTNVSITLTRSGALLTSVSVDFATANITATNGVDYTGTNGTATFPANTSSKTFIIPIKDNTVVDNNRTFRFAISNPQGGVQLGTTTNVTVTITNNDFGGVIQFASATFSGTEGSNAVITLTRTGGLASGVYIYVSMVGGTATAGLDYTNMSGYVAFNAGETNKTILVPLILDSLNEPTETVSLFFGPVLGGASIGAQNTAILNVLNKPDPNAVPLNGPLFMTWKIGSTTITANIVAGAADTHGGNLIVTGTATSSSDFKQLLMDVGPSVPGTLSLTDAGLHGTCSYTVSPFSGVGAKNWDLAGSSSNNGSTGTFIYDAIDHTLKLASGRFTLHLFQTTGVGTGTFIDIVGSFRIALL